MRKWYSALLVVSLPIILTVLSFKMRSHPNKLNRIRNWMGFSSHNVTNNGVWIHAASVGEVHAAVPLIQALRLSYPTIPITITTQSATGQACVHNLLGNQVSSQYCPLDLPGACKRFLRNNKPRLVIILETEIWPNLLNQLNKHKIPVLLANARLSERSVDAYRRWASLFKPALNSLTHIFAQSDQDALNFLRLGVDRRSVSISGNLKFDYKTCDTVKEEGLSLRKKIGKKRPVWIAASTHAFEEEAVLAVFEKLKQTLPDLLLIWVPRHPERFEPLAKHLLTTSYQIYRLSQGRAIQSKHDILLCDVMGKLNMLYHASDVAFIGGSLTQGQGHNPLEAATADCAIITGDCISSFAEICGFLMKDQAQIIVADADALADATLTLFQNPELRAHMTQAALTCAQLHQGAVDKHMEIIQSCI